MVLTLQCFSDYDAVNNISFVCNVFFNLLLGSGLTQGNYKELNILYAKYKTKGMSLAFLGL